MNKEYNKALVERYPFLLPRNLMDDQVVENYDYEYTELDNMPEGWRKNFGQQMCEEIRQALLEAQEQDPEGGYEESLISTNYNSDRIIPYLEGFRIEEIKEKYGFLRFYCSPAPQKVFDIIDKYEKMSAKICIRCGKPAEYVSTGWISPWCSECKEEIEKEGCYDNFKKIEEFYKG